MALQAKQTTQQRLMLAPNVTLALEVLRMPTMELQAFLQQQAEENPLLELEESDLEEVEAAPETASPEDTQPSNGLDEEWLSHWENGPVQEDAADDPEDTHRLLEQRLTKPQSLHESLRIQLGCQPLSEEDHRLGEALIDHINESGYLDEPLEALAAEMGAVLEQLEAVLKIIQRFDPSGVGARDLRECLMLQLEHCEQSGDLPALSAVPSRTGQAGAPNSSSPDAAQARLSYRILQYHFPLFMQRRLGAIAKATNVSLEQIQDACECLKQLNPKPGSFFASDLSPSIIPDLLVRQREKQYDVELNDQDIPRVWISRAYHRMLTDPNTPGEAKAFLQKKFRQASWIIKAIEERNTTLLAIGRCLISLQRDFVEQGPRALKPLTQSQVAELIGRHASTVSRAIAGKTMDTPYGVFRLEELFASSIPQASGSDSVSDANIKAKIQQLITEEDACHPLSDAILVKRLVERNVSVARRTIAKYRTSLRILPAHLRKRRA